MDSGDVESRQARYPIEASRFAHARRVVELAWRDLPRAHRLLLENIGASQRQVVDRPLGTHTDGLLGSAGYKSLTRAERDDLDRAVGVWVPQLRLVLVDAGHPAICGLDDRTYEAMLARAAWHEWGHALSVVRAGSDDVAAGARLLDRAPEGIREVIRRARYRRQEYTHELVAEIYALLMSRRRRGQMGQPPWLDDEVYEFVRRVSGWSG